jgi:hypothetical protein
MESKVSKVWWPVIFMALILLGLSYSINSLVDYVKELSE